MVFKKTIFQNRYVALETPSRPPPFMSNTILNFHFDYWNPSLISILLVYTGWLPRSSHPCSVKKWKNPMSQPELNLSSLWLACWPFFNAVVNKSPCMIPTQTFIYRMISFQDKEIVQHLIIVTLANRTPEGWRCGSRPLSCFSSAGQGAPWQRTSVPTFCSFSLTTSAMEILGSLASIFSR